VRREGEAGEAGEADKADGMSDGEESDTKRADGRIGGQR